MTALQAHRIALQTMLRQNAAVRADRVRRRILDNLDDQARKFLRIIAEAERDMANGFERGALIMFSIHGGAPAIANILRQSEHHREQVQRKVAA